MNVLIIGVLLFVSAAIDSGEAVMCYECSFVSGLSGFEPGQDRCNDPFTGGEIISDYSGVVCRKNIVLSGRHQVLNRGCLGTPANSGCYTSATGEVKTEPCVCNTEYCNGASTQRIYVTSAMSHAGFAVITMWL
ncbi:hypothetical protein LSAT2_032244 [Lamellibrachia satsuma]|nr:hypothetical protein LSAT2_032244 [Lamellibrachia satsuma]